MKANHSMIAALGLAFGLSASANAATTDPEVIIYRFPGVFDDGGAFGVGTATAFHCTNFSGATEILRFVTRNFDTTLKTNVTTVLAHLETRTMFTRGVPSYTNGGSLATGNVGQGTTAIAATSTNIICTAMTIDAAATKPLGVALRGIRFNPIPGSQE